jgi:hypothetical protein
MVCVCPPVRPLFICGRQGQVVPQIFIALKNPLLSVGFEPSNLESSGKHDNQIPPRMAFIRIDLLQHIRAIRIKRNPHFEKKLLKYYKPYKRHQLQHDALQEVTVLPNLRKQISLICVFSILKVTEPKRGFHFILVTLYFT